MAFKPSHYAHTRSHLYSEPQTYGSHLDKLWRQLEGRALKPKVLSRRAGQDESKVNVDDVALGVQENVAIMPGDGGGRGWGGVGALVAPSMDSIIV